jgi:hypothetical protein
MLRLCYHLGITLVLILILLVGTAPPVFAAPGDETTVGSLDLTATFECISVYSNFSDDDNEDNFASFEWRKAGGSWKQGMALTVDRRATVTSEDGTYTNDFQNQWRGSILGLTPGTQYEVRVTYTDPNGVFGINPVTRTITTRSDSFTLGSGDTYYVATNGSDSNPGTVALPWRTIQHAADNVGAGDTVYIKEGTYTELVTLSASGTAENWITFLNYSDDTVTIDGQGIRRCLIFSNNVHHNRVKGLRFLNNDNGYAVTVSNGSWDIVIEDNYFSGYDGAMIIGTDWEVGSNVGNVVIQNNDIYVTTIPTSAQHIVSFRNANGGGHVVRNNNLIDTTNNFPSGRYIDGIGGYRGAIPEAFVHKDSDIYNNYIEGIPDDAIEADGGNINVRIWNNTLKNNYVGISYNACITGPLYVFRNVVEINAPDRFSFNKLGHEGTGVSYNYHNTFYTTQADDGFRQTNDGLENVISRNNIIHTGRYAIEFKTGSGEGAGHDFDYDNLYSTDPTRLVYWGGGNYRTLTQFQTNTNPQQELHGMSIDATNEFVDASNGNFQLKSNSQFIDKGEVLVGFNDANSPWPYSGYAPDIGVYEYGSGPPLDNTPPYTTGHSPAKGSNSAPPDTNIIVHVRDSGTGVDQSSIAMRVNGATVYPTITGTPYDYTIAYNPPVDFAYEQVVSVSVDAKDLENNSMPRDNYNFTIASESEEPPAEWPIIPFRVNCAGANYTDSGGNLWNADQAYTTGEWGFYGPDNTIDRGTSTPISNTQDDRLFQTERYGLSGYRFDLGNGTYEISLLFAETYHASAGNRIFDVYVEGQLKLDNLDVYSRVGGNTALIETISGINVTDGQLNISFGEITELPMINGIMIITSTGNQSPVAASDTYSVEPGGILSVPAPGVLGNDYDVNWDPLSAVLTSDVTYGNLTLNVDGSFIYAPDSGYTGTDAFSYRANDGQENSNTAIVTISIIEGGGNGGGGGGDDNTEITSVYSYTTSAGKFNIGVTAKSSDDIVEIEIPKDTIGTNKMGVRLTSITIEKLVTNVPPPPDNAIILGDVYNITPDGAIFNPAIYLKMKYSNSQVPYSVAEKNLVIGTYSWSTGKWQLLPSSCDPNNNVVTANLEHLSTYAILACTSPANFEVTGISTSSDSIHCGNNFDIQVTVVNTGDLAGDYEVCLMLDDIALATEYITLDGGDSTIVTFSASTETAGEHTIKIGTKEMKFTVDEAQVAATFTISNINISPSEIYLGESVEIGTMISNTGYLSGIYEAILKIDNEYIESKSVGIAGGDSEIIIFTFVPDTEGEHAINIGDKVEFLKVNSAAGADIEIITRSQPEISRFDITPTYNSQTGKIESTRIDYQIKNYEELGPGAVLTLKVFRDGEIWEEITLITLNHLEPGEDSGYLSYVPSAGWDIGTYIFEVELQEESGAIHSIQFEKFTLIEESITKAVSWGSLGFIIGGTLVVLLTVLGIIIYRRREMLRGYVE